MRALKNKKSKSNKKFSAKMFFGGIFVFAISLSFFGGNFAQNSANFAKAENSQNLISAQNSEISANENFSETIRAISNDNGGDAWIKFDGKSWIKTNFSHKIGDTIFADASRDIENTALDTNSIEHVISAGFYDDAANLNFGYLVDYGGFLRFYGVGDYDGNAAKSVNEVEIGSRYQIFAKGGGDFSVTIDGENSEILFNPVGDSADISANYAIGTWLNFEGEPKYPERVFKSKLFGVKISRANGEVAGDFIPAAKYSGCGENFVLEYGFIDRANGNKFYGNSSTTGGILRGSEEILTPKCEIENEENSENSENDSGNSAKILAPATGILAREKF